MADISRYKETYATSGEVYQVFRDIAANKNGSYARETSRRLDKNENNISRIYTALKHLNLIEKSKRSKAQYYKISAEGLLDKQKDFTEYEGLEKEFTVEYVKMYVKFHKKSSIRKMLRDDFVTIFSSYSKFKEIPEFLEEFLDTPEAEAFDSRHMEIAETVLSDEE